MKLSHKAYLRLIKIANFFLRPFAFARSTLQVLAPFTITSSTTWIALNKLDAMTSWFPVIDTRKAFIIMATILVGSFAALPAYLQRKSQHRLTELIRKQYSGYVIAKIEEKLDKQIEILMKGSNDTQLTMSIMIPCGSQPLKQANTIRIVAASEKIRRLPSVYLQLDWDEGVAGRVWRHGIRSRALVVRVPESFEKMAINPISKLKKSSQFGHKVGVCLPISSSYKAETTARFLGVLCVGSNNEGDYDRFQASDFTDSLYAFIDTQLREDVGLLLV